MWLREKEKEIVGENVYVWVRERGTDSICVSGRKKGRESMYG